MKSLYLSVIIPAYNLSQNYIPQSLPQVFDYLKHQKFTWEVLLVDDGSTDDTKDILEEFASSHKGFNVLSIPHMGKAGAVKAGVQKAVGDIILFTDFDQSTPLSEFDKFKEAFDANADVVIAQRVRQSTNDTFASKLRSRLFNLATQAVVLPGISDTQCGFKAFKNEIAKYLFANLHVTKPKPINGPFMGSFDVEILFLARLKNYKIVSIPVTWVREDSKNLKFSEPFKALFDLVRIRIWYLFHKP